MNKQEYQEMRNEFAELVYNYEAFLKSGFLTDCRYNISFFNELKRVRKAEAELNIIVGAIKAKESHPIDDVLKSIENAKQNYKNELIQTENKNNYCRQLLSIIDKFDKSVFDASEKYFKDFIYEYHPVVNLNAKKEAKDAYDMLKRFYVECNHLGFKEFLGQNIEFFKVPEITEDRYVEASQVYFRFRGTINESINKLKDTYPYNKYEIFNDEMTVLAERDDIEIKAKKMEEALKSARADFKSTFGFDFVLVDEKDGK